MRQVEIAPTFKAWQTAARALLQQQVPPEEVMWCSSRAAQESLFAANGLGATEGKDLTSASQTSRTANITQPPQDSPVIMVPAAFVQIARRVALHRDDSKWSLLYSILWRITHENRNLLRVTVDDEVNRLVQMNREVTHDSHRMQAFVRFRKVVQDGAEHYVAWYRPDHLIVPMVAPFFANRFAVMKWSILTPDCCAHWNGKGLRFSTGVDRSSAPGEDEFEDFWRTYYQATFNPARLNVGLMRQEMPARFWAAMPEADAIASALVEAPARLDRMAQAAREAASAAPFVPATTDITALREAARRCTGCKLHCRATQTVFGEGPQNARIVLIGEQPGDQEDVAGRPFVGPAGELLNRALREAGLDREAVYVTTAVKHFKFVERGKRRLHQTPRPMDVVACRPWLEAELNAIQPQVIVCLGATASRALLGGTFQLIRERGRVLRTRWAPRLIATIHPSAVLRAQTPENEGALYSMLVVDLRLAVQESVLNSEPQAVSD